MTSAAPVAEAQIFLGTAANFGVLGGSTVTNTGSTVVSQQPGATGNLGVWPGLAVTGFPPGVVVPPGIIHAGNAVAMQAQGDTTTAYNFLAGLPCGTDLSGQDLGGMTLTPGVYCFSSSAQLTGNLTLNALGNNQAIFVFQIGTTLTTASSSNVFVINSGQACNVSWQVGTSATLGTGTAFVGNIVALASVTLNTAASVLGRALARNGAVTLDTNAVTVPVCLLPPTPTFTPTTGPTPTSTGTPTPGPSPTSTATNTPSPTSTATRTNTSTPSPTSTSTPTTGPTPTFTNTPTPGPSPTRTITPLPVGGFGEGGFGAAKSADSVPTRSGFAWWLAVLVLGMLAVAAAVAVRRSAEGQRNP